MLRKMITPGFLLIASVLQQACDVGADDLTRKPFADRAEWRLAEARQPLDLDRLPDQGYFETDTEVGFATLTTHVTFDRQRGDITHIVDRKTGLDFVARTERRPLFRLQVSVPEQVNRLVFGYATKHEVYNYYGRMIHADEFRSVRFEKTDLGGLLLVFQDHPELALRVTASVSFADQGKLRFDLQVTNESEFAVAAVRYPQFAYPALIGERHEDMCVVWPAIWTDGSIIRGPGRYTQEMAPLYPRQAFAQFTAVYSPQAGLYLASLDSSGGSKVWSYVSEKDRYVEMTLDHRLPEERIQEVSLPGTILGAFHGDWMTAADIYKQFAKQQFWCAKTIRERDDIPKYLTEGTGVLIGGIKSPEAVAGQMAQYKARSELAHMVFIPYGWENRGAWAGINYLPARPSNEAWTRVAAELKQQGDYLGLMTSGFRWVVKHAQGKWDDSAQFERMKGYCAALGNGRPWIGSGGPGAGWKNRGGKVAYLCHGSQGAQEWMRDQFLGISKLGVSLISFDQELGGGQKIPCYSTTHGHGRGYGNYMWTDFRDLCQEILDKGKPGNPELGLFLENVSELAIPWMSTYWSRGFGVVDRIVAGSESVGLFSYLYHEYIPVIGAAMVQGQGAPGANPEAGLRQCVLANCLVRGMIPGPFMHQIQLEPKNDWQRRVTEAYFSYCKPYRRFPEYLLMGVTQRPPELNCQAVTFMYQPANNQSIVPEKAIGRKMPTTLPAVKCGTFRAADGSLGTIIVNTTDQPQEATVMLPTSVNAATLYRFDRSVEREHGALKAGSSIHLSLEPYATRMLITAN